MNSVQERFSREKGANALFITRDTSRYRATGPLFLTRGQYVDNLLFRCIEGSIVLIVLNPSSQLGCTVRHVSTLCQLTLCHH